MNRFRLLEATPKQEFEFYTGLDREIVKPTMDWALSKITSRKPKNIGRSPSTVSYFK
ncbi:coproporphyrinogen III oxidase [Actinobacillus equuli]|nr:coproporphyrinogen III oxidase [Actinobacillus equuli]